MGSAETIIYLIYPDGYREKVATFQSGISKSKAGGGMHLGYALWLRDNQAELRELVKKHPGVMIDVQESE